jgi:hypothetical protein
MMATCWTLMLLYAMFPRVSMILEHVRHTKSGRTKGSGKTKQIKTGRNQTCLANKAVVGVHPEFGLCVLQFSASNLLPLNACDCVSCRRFYCEGL